jgi:hypothetical protein
VEKGRKGKRREGKHNKKEREHKSDAPPCTHRLRIQTLVIID